MYMYMYLYSHPLSSRSLQLRRLTWWTEFSPTEWETQWVRKRGSFMETLWRNSLSSTRTSEYMYSSSLFSSPSLSLPPSLLHSLPLLSPHVFHYTHTHCISPPVPTYTVSGPHSISYSEGTGGLMGRWSDTKPSKHPWESSQISMMSHLTPSTLRSTEHWT